MDGLIRQPRLISIAPVVWLFLLVVVILSLGYQNGPYTALCLLTMFVIISFTWRINMPGILPFAFLMQWVQVISYVIWMNVSDKPIDYLSKSVPYALIAACIGLFCMAAAITLVVRKLPTYTDKDFQDFAAKVNERKILTLYIVSTLFLSSVGFVFGNTSGLAQILVTVASLKWIFFMWYGYVAWVNKKNKIILLVILLYEFSVGLYSYFSSFKEVLFYTILVSLTFVKYITFRQFISFVLMGFLLIAIFFTWTVIKGSYREFLNKGSRQQVIEVSQSEAYSKITDNIKNLTWQNYQKATGAALYRIQYVFHLARVMDRIPAVIPHENGHVWWENITFVLTPRILYPDKPYYEATVKTNKYTGFKYAGLQKGTAYSLGYFADSYVDFGYVGMLFPLVMLALFIGLIFRSFYNMINLNLFFRFAVINVTLYNFISFEADGLFLFGRLLTNFVVLWAFCKFLVPSIQKWLYK
jgi:hypothetical protein